MTIKLLALLIWFFQSNNPVLNIKIKNVKSKALIRMVLYKTPDNFPENGKFDYFKEFYPNTTGELSFDWKDVPAGDYAMALYQDLNANKVLDKNLVGYPSEPFAFSRNFKPRFSAPKFDQCKFNLGAKGTSLSITFLN